MKGNRKYISLRLKTLVLTCAALICLTGMIAWLSTHNLEQQFQQQRSQRYLELRNTLNVMLGANQQQVRQLVEAYIVGRTLANRAPLSEQTFPLRSLFGFLNHHHPAVESIFLISDNNQVMQAGRSPVQVNLSQISTWSRLVNDKSYYWCPSACYQTLVYDISTGPGNSRKLVVFYNLHTLVHAISNNAGILAFTLSDSMNVRAIENELSNTLSSASSPKLVNSIARQLPLHQDNVFVHEIYKESWEVNQISLDAAEGQARVIVLNNNETEKQKITQTLKEVALFGFLAALLTAALLNLLLSRSLNRLRHTVKTLPLIAQRDFGEVERQIKRVTHAKYYDEIDLLNETSLALSSQIQSLETQVNVQNHSLSQRLAELARERDFVTRLLNTAPVMILTLTTTGKIRQCNQFARDLIELPQSELTDKHFNDLHSDTELNGELQTLFDQMLDGTISDFHHEGHVRCQHSMPRAVVWYHTCLDSPNKDRKQILSVGLDITDRKEAELRLAWLADHDPLTGLMNRRKLQQTLQKRLANASSSGAFLFFDLDQFKLVNDTSGHAAGDELLKLVSKNLQRELKPDDILARFGGDEFAILLDKATVSQALDTATRVNQRLASLEFSAAGRRHHVSASIGIAMYPHHGNSVKDLMANADLAMYEAKSLGSGHSHLFTDDTELRKRAYKQVYWKARIEKALREDLLDVFYQPIKSLSTDTITHFEALLRLQDEHGEWISSSAFIEIAETTGLIHEIDRFVIDHAMADMAHLNQQGIITNFSINLSGSAFNDKKLLPHIKDTLSKYQLDPNHIILEITETAAVADFKAATSLIDSLHRLGCRFALDDFGVGFASFNYLKQMPVDIIKIDGSFIRDLDKNEDDRILVRALCDVATGFGKRIIAEYVESITTENILREMGINYAQGFHIGKAEPIEKTFQMLRLMNQE